MAQSDLGSTVLTFGRVSAGVFFSSIIFWVYCLVRFWRDTEQPHFQIRGVSLVAAYLLSSGLLTCILIPVYAFVSTTPNMSDPSRELTQIWVAYSHCVFGSLAVMLVICRIFLNWINIRRNEESAVWKRQIDFSYTHWILRYYHILGNSTKILAFCLIFWFVESFCGYLLIFHNDPKYTLHQALPHYMMLITAVASFQGVGCMYVIIKSKGFVDYWGINNEFKLIFRSLLFVLVLTGVCVAVMFRAVSHEITTAVLVIDVPWSVFYVCSWYIQIIWVQRLHMKKTLNVSRNLTKLRTQLGGANRKDLDRKPSGVTYMKRELVETLQQPQGYEMLMTHVKKEFAVECILFVTIMIQWTAVLMGKGFLEDVDEKEYLLERPIRLPSNVPISPIVKYNDEMNDTENFVHVFELIYRQFIETNNAPFELNFDGDTRNELREFWTDIQTKRSSGEKLDDKEFVLKVWRKLMKVQKLIFGYLYMSFVRLKLDHKKRIEPNVVVMSISVTDVSAASTV